MKVRSKLLIIYNIHYINYNISKNKMNEHSFHYQENIGKGTYGSVYLCLNKSTNKYCAIKKINTKNLNDSEKEDIHNEIKLLQSMSHPNIVNLKGSFMDEENKFFHIVMEYCNEGDSYSKLRKIRLSEKEIVMNIVQIGLALSYIHDMKYLHRDLKTQNIFIKSDFHMDSLRNIGQIIKIGDFGIAKEYHLSKNKGNSLIGTPLYMSPEQYQTNKHTFKSDIWSFGCCLHEMCNQKTTFSGTTWNGVARKVLKGSIPTIKQGYSKEIKDLIYQMLSVSPHNRPTISSILEKKYIRKYLIEYIVWYVLSSHEDFDIDEDLKVRHDMILKEQGKKLGVYDEIETELERRKTSRIQLESVINLDERKKDKDYPIKMRINEMNEEKIKYIEEYIGEEEYKRVYDICKLYKESNKLYMSNEFIVNTIEDNMKEYYLLVNSILIMNSIIDE